MISGQKIYNLMTKILAESGIKSSAKIYKSTPDKGSWLIKAFISETPVRGVGSCLYEPGASP